MTTPDTERTRTMFPALRLLETHYLPVVGHMPPFKRPPVPRVLDLVHTPRFNWASSEVLSEAELVTFDVAAAYLSAASGTKLAHGALERTGPMEIHDKKQILPGYYRIYVYPWTHGHRLPNPLGTNLDPDAATVWVAHPVLVLLLELAEDETIAWPGVDVLDSYTCDTHCDLSKWTTRLREERKAIIKTAGECEELSPEWAHAMETYDAFKRGYSAALAMIKMAPDPKDTPKEERRKKNILHRPDWTDAIYAAHAVNLWRKVWRFTQYTNRPVLAVQETDEVVTYAEDFVYASRLPRPPFRVDPTGIALGSMRVKHYGWER